MQSLLTFVLQVAPLQAYSARPDTWEPVALKHLQLVTRAESDLLERQMTSQELTLPNPLASVRQLVLDAVSSPLTRVMYAHAIEEFRWSEDQGRPAFTRATV